MNNENAHQTNQQTNAPLHNTNIIVLFVMDSSNIQTTNSTGSASSDTTDNSSLIIPSKRDIFLTTYRRQRFSLPDPIMHYIAKNPKNAKVYQKMIRSCKYFFTKNPLLIISHLTFDGYGWRTWIKNDLKIVDINRFSSKLWIKESLSVSTENVSIVASSIVSKIYRSDFKILTLLYQSISLNDLLIFCSSVNGLTLKRVAVKNYDDTVVPFEKVIEQLPKVKTINYTFTNPSNNTSENTLKELWKIPHFSNYDYFCLYNIPESFDIESFNFFMKNTRIRLFFSNTISEEYKARLMVIVDQIIESKNREYKPPYIYFRGNNLAKSNELYYIHLFSK
uniref:Uncharacterized protein n=1 Tax=Panagrolaimus superbus TaxID=310955 RepID=A0A914Z6N7_9BILA